MSFDLLEKRKNEMYRRAYPKLLLLFVSLSVLAVILTLTLTLITHAITRGKYYSRIVISLIRFLLVHVGTMYK